MKVHCKFDELIDPKLLKNHPKNRNKHGQDQIDRLAKLYEFHGIRHPIIVSQRSGFIVAGHGRKLASIRAGLKEMPVVYQNFDSEEQEYAFVQSDNAIALWAELDLSGIHEDLPDLEPFDLDMLGIEDFKLEPDPKEGLTDEDAVPEVKETNVKLGDVYKLGEHRLMCGDSTFIDNVEKVTGGIKCDLLTDPPYGINANKQTLGNGKKDFHSGEDWDKEVPEFFHLLPFFNKHILWGGNYFADKLKPSNNWLCWYKKISGVSFSEFELAYTNLGKNCRHFEHHWSGEQKLHPTMKPVSVMEWCLSYLGENICDLFGGSGSTLIACEKTNRKCFMMELDPHYCQVIIDRWEAYTGKKAHKI